jgi:FSR family fosmidomycin resistance protein-like MFS transporter
MFVLFNVGRWYRDKLAVLKAKPRGGEIKAAHSRARIAVSITILMLLVFSKNFYTASFTSYFTFYLISKFQVSVQDAQIYLFVFLGAVAAGTVLGGPVGDRIGRRYVIWISILGVLPFTLVLPYASLLWTVVLSVVIGLILASAFSAILVYATELVPGRVGMIAGLFFGLSFGMGGLGAAVLGQLADMTSIETVYKVVSFLPAIGHLAYFLPKIERSHAR